MIRCRTEVRRAVIINHAGGVGKTTCSKHLLAPLLKPCQVFRIEHVNDSGASTAKQLAADEFRDVAGQINVGRSGSYVVDIGSSNSRQMLEQFEVYATTRDKVDLWLVPVIPDPKAVRDSVATAADLITIGVSASRIVFVPNMITRDKRLREDFGSVFEAAESAGIGVSVPLRANEIYRILQGLDENVVDMAQDPIDFEKLSSEAAARGDTQELEQLVRRWPLQDMAVMAAANLRAVFASLSLQVGVQEPVHAGAMS